MSVVEWIAAVLVVLGAVEMVVFVVRPRILVELGALLYDRPVLMQGAYLAGAGVVLYVLLGHLTLVEIMAAFAFAGLVMGVGIAPFGREIAEACLARLEEGTFWRDAWLMSLVWVLLILWTGYALFG